MLLFDGCEGNIAGYCTLVLYFPSPVACEKTAANTINCVVQSLGTDHSENMTYCSSLRNFDLLISSLNLSMLPSEI